MSIAEAAIIAETSRADTALLAEVHRAKVAEAINSKDIATNADKIAAEISRATAAEATNAGNIAAEVNRAKAAEATNADSIAAEISRAKAAEATNAGNIAAEVSRAKAAEATNAGNIAAEVSRAKAAEATNAGSIAAEISSAKAAEATNAGSIAAEVSRAKNAESAISASTNNAVSAHYQTSHTIECCLCPALSACLPIHKPTIIDGYNAWLSAHTALTLPFSAMPLQRRSDPSHSSTDQGSTRYNAEGCTDPSHMRRCGKVLTIFGADNHKHSCACLHMVN